MFNSSESLKQFQSPVQKSSIKTDNGNSAVHICSSITSKTDQNVGNGKVSNQITSKVCFEEESGIGLTATGSFLTVSASDERYHTEAGAAAALDHELQPSSATYGEADQEERSREETFPSIISSSSLRDHRHHPDQSSTIMTLPYFSQTTAAIASLPTIYPGAISSEDKIHLDVADEAIIATVNANSINWGNVEKEKSTQSQSPSHCFTLSYLSNVNQEEEVVISNAGVNVNGDENLKAEKSTENELFLCMESPHCKSSFRRLTSLKNHIKTCHEKFQCTLCDFVGESAAGLVRHGIFAHSITLIEVVDQKGRSGKERSQLQPQGNPKEKMIFVCFWSECTWKAVSEKLLTLHIMLEHLGVCMGRRNRAILKNYEFSIQHGELYTFWYWKNCDQETLPAQVSSSYEAIAAVATVPNPLPAPLVPVRVTDIPILNTPTTSSTTCSTSTSTTNHIEPVKVDFFQPATSSMAISDDVKDQEPCNEQQQIILYQIQHPLYPPLKRRPIFYCAQCDMHGDVARDVVLHEVRFHCKRWGLPKTSTILCHICDWMSSSEEYLVLHILRCHRLVQLNQWEDKELKDADVIFEAFFKLDSDEVKKQTKSLSNKTSAKPCTPKFKLKLKPGRKSKTDSEAVSDRCKGVLEPLYPSDLRTPIKRRYGGAKTPKQKKSRRKTAAISGANVTEQVTSSNESEAKRNI